MSLIIIALVFITLIFIDEYQCQWTHFHFRFWILMFHSPLYCSVRARFYHFVVRITQKQLKLITYRVYERRVRIGGFWKFSASTEAIESCNTAMERPFCELSEFFNFQNFRPLKKSTGWSKWKSAILVYAHMKSYWNFEVVWGPYGLQSFILVNSHSNELYFFT